MKTILITSGTIIFLSGSVWFFQGINLLPGSFMTGQPEWAIIGSLGMLIGGGLILWAMRRNQPDD